MKLLQLSGQTQQANDENAALRAVVINEMSGAAPILNFAEFYEMTGNADTPLKAATAAGGAERTINNDYPDNRTAPTYGSVALKIYGDKIETDLAYERRGLDIGSERTRQLVTFSQALGRHVQDHIVNGDADSDAKQFNGLKKRIGTNESIVLGGGANGAQVLLGNSDSAVASQQMFKEYVDELLASVVGGASVLLVPPKGISRMTTIGMQFVQKGAVDAVFAEQLGVYNGVPVVNAGYKKNGSSLVIGYAETQGTSTDCTSFYAVRFGEKENTTFATNVGVQVKDRGLVGVLYTTMVDFDLDMEILNPKSAWRLKGIRF
jgi:hypothetical protein